MIYSVRSYQLEFDLFILCFYYSDTVNLMLQVSACNIVYEVMDGRVVMSSFMDEMRRGGQKAAEFLLMVCDSFLIWMQNCYW